MVSVYHAAQPKFVNLTAPQIGLSRRRAKDHGQKGNEKFLSENPA
jgi:hypothetical protein